MPKNDKKQGVLEANPARQQRESRRPAKFGEKPETGETMRIFKKPDVARPVTGRPPVEGGPRAEGVAADRTYGDAADTAQWRGMQEAFILVRQGQDRAQTPIWQTDDGGERVIALFTSREKAILYLQTADWHQTHEPRSLSPTDLGSWLGDARAEGVHFMAIDPDRLGQVHGEAQSVVALDELGDWSDNEIHGKIQEVVKP